MAIYTSPAMLMSCICNWIAYHVVSHCVQRFNQIRVCGLLIRTLLRNQIIDESTAVLNYTNTTGANILFTQIFDLTELLPIEKEISCQTEIMRMRTYINGFAISIFHRNKCLLELNGNTTAHAQIGGNTMSERVLIWRGK